MRIRSRALPIGGRAAILVVSAAVLLLLVGLGAITDRGSGLTRAESSAGTVASAAVPSTSYTSNGVSAPPTAYPAGTFDASDGYVLMFGGLDEYGLPDAWTWSFVHGNWTNLTGAVGVAPSARWGASMVYDPAAGYALLFGGCLDPSCSLVAGDTWSYAHDRWTNLTGSTTAAPPARGEASMTYDEQDGCVLLFGGLGADQAALNDAWCFEGRQWSALSASKTVPAPRVNAMMSYDSALGEVVLFGGRSATGDLDDTWTFANGSWSNDTAIGTLSPGARNSGMMVFDAAGNYLMLVNGAHGSSFLDDEWSFDGSWSELAVAGHPEASYGALLVYDPVDAYVVYFSGYVASGSLLTSTLVYSGGTWTLLINPTIAVPNPFYVALLVAVIIGIMMGGAVVFAGYARRRRESRLGEGFDFPPGTPVVWVGSGDALRGYLRQRLIPVLAVFVVIPAVLFLAGGSAVLIILVIEVPIFAILAVVLVWVTVGQVTRQIGIAQSGVIIRRRQGELRIAWTQIQPGILPPRRGWYWFQSFQPGSAATLGGFATTVGQARAMVQSEFSPPWVLVPAVASGLGVPNQRASPASSPPATPTTTATAAVAPVPPVPPPTNRPYSPTPAPAQPLQTDAGAWSSRPPPGMRACPRCGQLAPQTQVFCGACGARIQ